MIHQITPQNSITQTMKKPIAIGLLNLAVASASWSITPAEIIKNVKAKYAGLDSIAFDSAIVLDIDTTDSEIDGGPRKVVTTCKVRLARPGFYRIEWKTARQGAGARTSADVGAAWSSGERHFLLSGGKVTEPDGLDYTFSAATGISNGAVEIPHFFFDRSPALLECMYSATVLPDENVGGIDCYVLSTDIAGKKRILWISKDFLVIQIRSHYGGKPAISLRERSDAELESSLQRVGRPVTPEAVAQLRKALQNAKEMSGRTTGSNTQTVESIELNPSFEKELFEIKNGDLPGLPR
jgi:hypothetical protein